MASANGDVIVLATAPRMTASTLGERTKKGELNVLAQVKRRLKGSLLPSPSLPERPSRNLILERAPSWGP